MTHLVAGGIGGGITAAVATPFDTVKESVRNSRAMHHVSNFWILAVRILTWSLG